MRRRRLLALATAVGVVGCTGVEYRATGPRTPPPAPPTDDPTAPPADVAESRAQAVIRPLNESYRVFRGPLVTFDVTGVSRDDVSTAEDAVATAREAVGTFAAAVSDPPARYRSLPALVTAHELLVDALAVTVDLSASFPHPPTGRADDHDPAARLEPPRSQATRLGSLGSDLRDVATAEPAVPGALFLTPERMRSFATALVQQSRAVGQLLDAAAAALAGTTRWHSGVAAFERRAFADARTAFTAARTRYRTASDVLADTLETAGSFETATSRWSCATEAALDATATALDAVELGRNGNVARGTETLRAAQTARNRCEDG